VRFVVYGAGAIGGVLGAGLFAAGHDVVLVARGAHLDAIRRDGLRVETPDGVATHRISVVERPEEVDLGAHDAVLLCVKSQDTRAALDVLAGCAPAAIPVVCVQNGVANEREALRRFENVYGVCVMCPAAHLQPGVVEAHSSPTTGLADIGRYPDGVDGTARSVAAAFESAGFESVPRPDIMRWKHQKLLMNLANAVEAAAGAAARGSGLVGAAIREAIACYEAAGIAYASREEDRERRGDRLRIREVGGRPRGGGSSWQSLARGTGMIETDYLNGEIVLLGRLYGVPTPVNAMLQEVARELARTGAPPGSLTVEELLARVPDVSGGIRA